MGKDGRTAYERLRGKKFNSEVMEFGESVWYYIPGITGKKKMEERWNSGTWLGILENQASLL